MDWFYASKENAVYCYESCNFYLFFISYFSENDTLPETRSEGYDVFSQYAANNGKWLTDFSVVSYADIDSGKTKTTTTTETNLVKDGGNQGATRAKWTILENFPCLFTYVVQI